ncbi:unnamed protein product [Diatraea saccharalis]|uniref:Uncharacterized protein n=1 Tax=Diatraea saccharalis TaxID=40085 RepID=A0A9N9RDE5_9NEOP|nr:unnamed protein product [Diatraea saccharalis]
MESENNNLDWIEDGTHSLLEKPAPAYSNATVRRAFIVWLYCGQKNKFRDVCNYYHRLEALEATLPPEQRFASRSRELEMFINRPRTTSCLRKYFPELYTEHPPDPYYISKVESITNERCVFKLEGFHDYKQTGGSRREIFEVSKMVRQYCRSKSITLRKFLEEYRQHEKRCNIKGTMCSMASYIKKKQVEAELELVENIPTSFSFLDCSSDSGIETMSDEKPLESQQLKMILGVNPTNTQKPFVSPPLSENRFVSPTNTLQQFVNSNYTRKLFVIPTNTQKLYTSPTITLKNLVNPTHIPFSNKVDSTDKCDTNTSASCAEFFKLFQNKSGLEERCMSFTNIPLTFEDFAKALNMNHVKSKSVESVNRNILTNKASKRNKDKNRSYIKVSGLIQMETDSPVRKPNLYPISKKLFHSPLNENSSETSTSTQNSSPKNRKAKKRKHVLLNDSTEKIKKVYITECDRDGDGEGMRKKVLISLFHNKEYFMEFGS